METKRIDNPSVLVLRFPWGETDQAWKTYQELRKEYPDLWIWGLPEPLDIENWDEKELINLRDTIDKTLAQLKEKRE